MTLINISIPWIVLAAILLFAAVGLAFLSIKFWEWIRFLFFLIRGGFLPPKDDTLVDDESSVRADEDAQALLKKQIQDVWRSFSPVKWLDLTILRNDCHSLVKQIAQIYFPDSKTPELEVTMLEILQFNERTAHRIRSLLDQFPSFHRLTVASILDAKSLLERTKQTMDKKTVKSGRRVASRIWTAINAVNPNYWIQRFLFHGASEVIGRKVLTSVYRIVGTEAIQLYRSSSHQLSKKSMTLEEALDPDIIFEEPDESPNGTSKPEKEERSTKSQKAPQKETDESMTEDQEWILPDEEEESAQDSSSSSSSNPNEKMNVSIGKMLSGFVEGSLHLWDKMVSVDKVVAEFQKKNGAVQCLSDIESLPVETNDAVAESYISKGRWLTAAEGAATGFGGFLLLSADAVSLLALQLRTIQQIGYCYGFDVSRPEEKLFAAKLLAEAYAHPSSKDREALKNEMRMAANLVKEKTPFGLLQKRLFVQGFSKIAQKIGVRFGSRKATQIVPILGSAVGSIVNQQITKDIAKTAKEIYRERRLEKNNSSET